MTVGYSKDYVIPMTEKELLANKYRCLNTGTVIEFYIKEGSPTVYYNKQTNEFFQRPINKTTVTKKEVLRLIVAGGRDFKDYALLETTLDNILRSRKPEEVVIIQGEAYGADLLGKQYAKRKNIKCEGFPADWKGKGKAAGPIRNEEMAKTATACVCFWDQFSSGTKNMIDNANKYGLRLKVVHYE